MTIRQTRMLRLVRHSVILLIALAWVSSCTLQDFDKLGPGNSNAGGETGIGGKGGTTATSTDEGGRGGVSGNPGQAGRSNGAAGSGTTSSTSGGTAGTTGAGGLGGAATGSAGAAGTTGTNPQCPAYVGATGSLVSPPSTGFEVDGTWVTLTGQACHRTASTGSTDGCEGNYYLTCPGATRKATVDTAKFSVTAPVTGATYVATAVARFSPATAPASPGPLVLIAAYKCQSGTQQLPQLGSVQYTTSEWVRLGGEVKLTCDASALTDLYFYVDTLVGKPAGTYDSVDIDDLRVYQR